MPAEIHYLRKTSRVGATYEHRSKDWRFARDQREAGIENLEWEDRLPPCRSHPLAALIALACPPDMLTRLSRVALRPWMFWLAVIGSWALFAGAIWGMAALFADI